MYNLKEKKSIITTSFALNIPYHLPYYLINGSMDKVPIPPDMRGVGLVLYICIFSYLSMKTHVVGTH